MHKYDRALDPLNIVLDIDLIHSEAYNSEDECRCSINEVIENIIHL